VLELVGEGLTNRQIAERLNVGEKTVKNHVSHLLAKLDMQRRTQAAAASQDGSPGLPAAVSRGDDPPEPPAAVSR